MSVVLTKHAKERLMKYGKLDGKSAQTMTETAFEKGTKHSETKGTLNKWLTSLYFHSKTANNIRIYNNKAWIFAGKTLITIILVPNHLRNKPQSHKNTNKRNPLSPLKMAEQAFQRGEWVNCQTVQEFTGMSLDECFHLFDFSRSASWNSIVGTTPEQRQQNGQNIVSLFRLKQGQKYDPKTKKVKVYGKLKN